MSIANITVLGRLGGDPESRMTQTGKSVVSFSVAVDDGVGNDKHTTWFRCQAWEKLGENIHKFFKKGDGILVAGTIGSREWADRDGNKQTSWDVNVRQWSFVPGAKKSEGNGVPSPSGKTNYTPPNVDEDVAF